MTSSYLLLTAIVLLAQVVINILLSREIINWIPAKRDQTQLFILLWLLPLFGILIVYRKVRPGWFEREKDEPGLRSSAASGLLALDSIFNPGAAHILDAQKKSDITIRMEGEMYERNLPDSIDLNEEITEENTAEQEMK